MTVGAGHHQRVVQPRDQLGRLDVDRVLITERPALHADDEPELLDVLRKVGEREAGLFAFVPVEKLERLEVAEKLEAGPLPVRQRVEVRAGLLRCSGQVASGAFLLDQQNAGSECVSNRGYRQGFPRRSSRKAPAGQVGSAVVGYRHRPC